jgi:hypothetical protein
MFFNSSMFSILFQSKEMQLVNRSRALVELSKLVLTYYFSHHISQLYPELSSDQSMGKSVYWVNEMYAKDFEYFDYDKISL